METMTTVESVEKLESGSFRIKLLGDVTAGTRDAEIGALAERLAGEENANPVEVKIDKLPGGKLLIKSMQEVLPPAELGGSEEPAPVIGDTGPAIATLSQEQYDALPEEEKDLYYLVPEMSPPQEPRWIAKEEGEMEKKPEVVTVDIGAYSNEDLLAEVARRMH